MFGDVLPDDFFCEKAGRRTAAAFGMWLFLPGGEGVGADAVPGCYFAIGAIFKFCKDFFTDMGWIGHDFDGYRFFCYLTICRLVGPIFLPPDASPTITPLEREYTTPPLGDFHRT